eukprot:m.43041 g.43041  ORF g.43041 m.43041 type:complete len:418 (-) comp15044_c0_seq6:9-1262(-)
MMPPAKTIRRLLSNVSILSCRAKFTSSCTQGRSTCDISKATSSCRFVHSARVTRIYPRGQRPMAAEPLIESSSSSSSSWANRLFLPATCAAAAVATWYVNVVSNEHNAAAMYSTIPMEQEDETDDTDISVDWMNARVTPFGRVRPMRGPRSPESILLLSDIDGTLTGAKQGLEEFNSHWLKDEAPQGSYLVYNTARPRGPGPTKSGYCELVEKHHNDNTLHFVVPDALIVGEGTEIYWFDDLEEATPRIDEEWDNMLQHCWDRQKVAALLDPHDERIWLPELQINDDNKYRYAITVGSEERAMRLTELFQDTLDSNTYTVAYVPMTWMPGNFIITVLPRIAGKSSAARYVARKLGFTGRVVCVACPVDNQHLSRCAARIGVQYAGWRVVALARFTGVGVCLALMQSACVPPHRRFHA